MTAPNPQLMFIGQQCALDDCRQSDFLPLKCAYCHAPYCSAHFDVAVHKCSAGTKALQEADVRRPLCPLCGEAPAWSRGVESAEQALTRHLTARRVVKPSSSRRAVGVGLAAKSRLLATAGPSATPAEKEDWEWQTECTALDADGSRKETRARTNDGHAHKRLCAEKRCKKHLLVDIICPDCKASFCPSHRTPQSHACTASVSQHAHAGTSGRILGVAGAGESSKSRLLDLVPGSASNKGSHSTKAMNGNLSAAKGTLLNDRSLSDPPKAGAVTAPAQSKSNASPSSLLKAIPGTSSNKLDKRILAEQHSLLKALERKRELGILSESEKVKLAQIVAVRESSRRRGAKEAREDCRVA